MDKHNDWHTVSDEEAAKRLNVNPFRGLSAKDVRRRRSKHGKNDIWYVSRMETGGYFLRAAGDLSTVLLLITAVLAFLFEDQAGAAVAMCAILAIGAVLRIVTYVKAKRILEDNAAENIPSAAVLREGAVTLVSSTALVPGDIVLLRGGDTVPCDGRVIADGEALVSETGITENKEHVRKFNTVITAGPGSAEIPCESRPNILYAGSVLLQGELRMLVTATGDDALIVRKQDGIEIPSGDELPLIRRLNGQCRASELFMLAFVLVISVLSLLLHNGLLARETVVFPTQAPTARTLSEVFFCAVAMAAASMSEYLTAIGCIIIAVAARRKRGSAAGDAVIKDCARLEDIAAARTVILGDLSLLKSGKVAFGTFFAGGTVCKKEAIADRKTELRELITLASEASGIWAEASALSQGAASGDAPLGERESIVKQAGILLREQTGISVSQKHPVVDRLPGTAAMTAGIDTAILQPVSAASAETGAYVVALSDVQRILRCCTTYMTPDGERPLTDAVRRTIFTETARLEYIGAKVLAVAKRPSPFLTLTKVATLLTGMCFMGFFSLSEMPAEGAAEAVRQIKAAGMRCILLSANPEHDLYYGHDLGLFDRHTKIIPHTEVRADAIPNAACAIVTVPPYRHLSPPDDLSTAAARYGVVRQLGGEGTVFLTKEAFDTRAIGKAACGIAVSRSGSRVVSQALKNKAQIIAFPRGEDEHGGFAEGIGAVCEARRAMVNIANANTYLAISQFARLLVVLVSVVLGTPMPSPIALLLGGTVFDFGAVLVMAFEKAPKNILSIPCSPLPSLRRQAKGILPAGLLTGLLSVAMPVLVNGVAPLLHVHALRSKEAVSLLVSAMFLAQGALAAQFMKRTPLLRRGTVLDAAAICYHGATVVFSLLILLWKPAATLIGGAAVPWYAAPTALLPSVVLLLAGEGFKRWKEKNPKISSKKVSKS